jgi:hypothetical protein
MDKACSTYGGEQKYAKVLLGKRVGKRSLGRPRSAWEGNMKLDFTLCILCIDNG